MRCLIPCLGSIALVLASATSPPSTLHIALIPSSGPPIPYLDIVHNTDMDSASILTTHPIPPPLADTSDADAIVGLGLARPDFPRSPAASTEWSTISVPKTALHPSLDRTLHLLLDRSGNPYHLAWTTTTANSSLSTGEGTLGPSSATKQTKPPKKTEHIPPAAQGTILVELRRPLTGQKPVLNRPVVLNQQGQVEGQDGADNRTFLQKYWWAIAAFLVFQVLAGSSGGGGEK